MKKFRDLLSETEVKPSMREDAQDEKRMMRSQLMFMAYAAKEIASYLDRVNDPEEWYQNKMATTHSMMKTLYSYAQGQMQSMDADDDLMAGYYGEDSKIDARKKDFKEKLRRLAYEKYGKKEEVELDENRLLKVDKLSSAEYQKAKKLKGFDKSKYKWDAEQQLYLKEEVEQVDESTKAYAASLEKIANDKKLKAITPKDREMLAKLADLMKKEGYRKPTAAEIAADKKKDGKKPEGNRHSRIKKKVYGKMMGGLKEAELEEANFKPGNLKLKDGSKVKLSMDDAKAITAVMKTLSPKNRKEMESRLMSDKKGFDEIMAFVQAAGI